MKKIILNTLGLLLILIATISCTKTTNNYYTTNNGTTLTGNVQGIVSLYDQTGTQIIVPSSALSGDTIAITNNTSGVVYKAITDATGTYKFTNLSAGTYSFVVTKPGYGYVNKYSFQLVGGGTLYQNFGLAQLISNNVATAQAVTDASGIQINGTLSSPALGQPSFVSVDVVAFASSAPSVSAEAGHFTISSSISALNGGVTSFSLPNMFIKSQLNNAGFASGSTVYIAVYLTNPYTVAFFNPVVNQTIFTTLSSTPVIVSAIVP